MKTLKRQRKSHKGDNGKVCIVGGNQIYHGAPIFSALGAEAAGADLVYPIVPKCHTDITKTYALNFIVQSFRKNYLTKLDEKIVLRTAEKCDCVVIGPGLGEKKETQTAVRNILKKIRTPVIIDAGALDSAAHIIFSDAYDRVLTPHRREFEEITREKLTRNTKKNAKTAVRLAKQAKAVVLLKGHIDIIADKTGRVGFNKTGNAGMTCGGTGDVLSGLVAGIAAQKIGLFNACLMATKILGKCADDLKKEKGYAYTSEDIIKKLPQMFN